MKNKKKIWDGFREIEIPIQILDFPDIILIGKTEKKFPVRVALVYPNFYKVGMSNLGFLTVFQWFRTIPMIKCERFFLSKQIDNFSTTQPRSFESGSFLSSFELIAFSICYEIDYFNIIKMLIASKIEPERIKRKPDEPLIMAGGAMTSMNPVPLFPVIDIFWIGEIEALMLSFIKILLEIKFGVQKLQKEKFLSKLYQIPGFLISREADNDLNEKQPKIIERRKIDSIKGKEAISPIISLKTTFSNTLLVEAMRGCPWQCKFCVTSRIGQPTRFGSAQSIWDKIEPFLTESVKLGIIGSDICGWNELESLLIRVKRKNLKIGLSSVRASALTKRIVKLCFDCGVNTLTMAPETGDESMRYLLGKEQPDDIYIESAEWMGKASIPYLKLYFLCGLQCEKDIQIIYLERFIKKIAKVYIERGKGKGIKVSLSPFVPKPFTPFQWGSYSNEIKLKTRMKEIRNKLNSIRGVSVTCASVSEFKIQAILARGDLNLGKLLIQTIQQKLPLRQLLQRTGLDENFYLGCKKGIENLPWNIIDPGISSQGLWHEYEKILDKLSKF